MMISDNFNATDYFKNEVVPRWKATKKKEFWRIAVNVPKKHLLEFLHILEKNKRKMKAEVEAPPARKGVWEWPGVLLAEVIIRNKKIDPLLEWEARQKEVKISFFLL